MRHIFQPGQKFTLTNPDWNIFEEVWTIVAVTYPTIEFSCWRRWHIDREYMQPTSITAFTGKVIREDEAGVILIDAHHISQTTGYRLAGYQVTYLSEAIFRGYLGGSAST